MVVRSRQRNRPSGAKRAHHGDKARAFLESLADLPIEIEDATRTRLFVSVRALLGQYKLTAYDASYLELAIRHKLPIAALDNALAKAARDAGVTIVQP